MDEQNDGLMKKTGDALKQGLKDQSKKSARRVFKKIIMAIAPILLKFVAVAVIAAILVTALSDFLDKLNGKTSKEADAFAVYYAGSSVGSSSSSNGEDDDDESSQNRIIVDVNNITEDGAYILTYEFKDDNGNLYTEAEALEKIKSDLVAENANLNIKQFSDSELKIIGALMYNGLKVDKYNEEELKALVIFVKADIASQSFDLRSASKIGEEVDLDEIAENDYVYGTLQIQRVQIEKNASGGLKYTPVLLEYIEYGDETTRRNILLYGKPKRYSCIRKILNK